MFNLGIIRRIVGNIPVFFGMERRTTTGQEYKTIVEKLPTRKLDFLSDRMDFSDCFTYVRGSQVIIDWRNVPEDARYLVKLFNLNNLDLGNKVTTERNKATILGNIIRVAESVNKKHKFLFLNEKDVIYAVETLWGTSYDSMKIGYSSFERFVEFIIDEKLADIRIDLQEIRTKIIQIEDRLPSRDKREHSPVIPPKMFHALLNGFYRIMRDESIKINDRMTAGTCLLNTQMGLRVSEIPALETDCLRYYVDENGEKNYYIVYNCIKGASATTEVVSVKTICTPLAKETIEYLLELRKRIPGSNKYRFLYCLDGKNCRIGRIYDKVSFYKRYKRICALYLYDVVSKDWEGIKHVSVRHEIIRLKAPDKGKYDTPLSIPGIHSYRTTFASMLYTQGFDIDYINAIMAHTPQSNDTNAYVPPKIVKMNIDKDPGLSDIFEDVNF